MSRTNTPSQGKGVVRHKKERTVRYQPLLGVASVPALIMALAISVPAYAQTSTTSSDDSSTTGDVAAPAAPAASDAGSDAAAPAAAAPAEAAPAAAAPAAAAPASGAAASSAPSQQLQNVTVTGSAISGPNAATAVPVTIYHANDLNKRGITSADQFLQKLGINNTSENTSSQNTTGAYTGGSSYANLRGLGSDKTLILLNGRRVIANASSGSSVDLNSIPFAAIDRIEVLRDSASALYGSDAVAGVINFITKKNYQGAEISTNQSTPTHSGGGQRQNYSFTWGTGDLDKDGFNWMGSMNYKNQRGQSHGGRTFYDNNPYNPQYGARFDGHAPYSQGGDFYQDGGCHGETNLHGVCGARSDHWGDYVSPEENTSLYTAATFKLGGNNTGELSYFWSHDTNIYKMSPYFTDISVDPGTKYYPSHNSEIDQSQPVDAYWLSPFEQNRMTYRNDVKRIQYAQRGSFGGWTYDSAIAYNRSTQRWNATTGFLNDDMLDSQVNSGQLDPFTDLTPRERRLVNGDRWHGKVFDATGESVNWDGHINHSLGDWFGAGPAEIAIGAEASHERFRSTAYDNPSPLKTGIADQKSGGSRDQQALWTQLDVPVLESLELTGSLRYDRYSQVGHSTNPKVSFRYQPVDNLTFRGSYSTSFVAPSLYDMYSPTSLTNVSNYIHDPATCPGGGVGNGCRILPMEKIGGNPNLKPEKSDEWSFGFIYEPVERLTTSADFWWYRVRDDIGQPSDQYALDHSDSSAVCRYGQDCATDPIQGGAPGSVYYFNNPIANIGKVHTNGVDLAANYLLPTSFGDWTFGVNGTYTFKYDTADGDGWHSGLGKSDPLNDNDVQFRFKGTAHVNWAKGGWNAGLAANYQTGYKDYQQDNPEYYENHPRVGSYTTFDLNAGYAFTNGMSVTLGSNNIFDRKPPFSAYLPQGVDSRYASTLGREVYAQMNYKF